ncbi:hypothetical protein TWF225_010395 [Orbilia oligospora]|uniref:Uncharacterized protein n=1 Tax=Orbilia oligospora TaxID=2813651 RepID=A0A8H2DV44_ORBOL|nr:hypothetical protein TWF225_010395 [Orbilia oligospora]TGJ65472.1 hypothetical protein EYR41_009436 [Orbilia oligospora]
MAKVKLSLTSIPLDAIYQILHTIDNKPDLDNVCLAFPCIGEIVAENTHIVKQLYWKEIQNDFFVPLALLNSTLNKSDEASQLLQSLVPPKHSEDDDDETSAQDSNIQLTPAALVKTLSPQTIFNMTITHMQIEKLAYIFMKNQLESHYPPPQIYRSPTCGERTRVIMAVYRAHIMVAMRFVNHPKFPISSSTYNTYLEISEKMIPHIQQEVFYILWDQWSYWDFKEVGVVLDKLWSELPMAVYREALGKGLDVDCNLFEVLQRRVRRKTESSSRQTEAEWMDDSISFMFSMRDWNPGKHVEFLENLGNRKKSADWLFATANDGDCLFPWIDWDDTPNCHKMNVALRTHLYFTTALRIRYLETEEITKETYTRPGQTWYCRPPPRRLVKGITGQVAVPRIKDTKYSRVSRTWISPNQENVCAMVVDCLWDDWRLKELGYFLPEFLGDGS